MAQSEEFRPVRDLLHPDPSDAHVDEAIARLDDNRALDEDQKNYPAIYESLKLLDLGFKVLPVRTNEKAPSSQEWERATQNYPQRFLRNPGTLNYGILPPEGCVILDVDKDSPQFINDLAATLGILPGTRTHASPKGLHLIFRWPDKYPQPLGAWWGRIVARWPLGHRQQGYVVGPGSHVKQPDGSIGEYRVLLDEDIEVLPDMWAESVLAYRPPRDLSTVGAGIDDNHDTYVLPSAVPEGGRYEAIVRYTAHLYNRGFDRNEMWAQVRTNLAPLFNPPLTEKDLRERFARATARDMESRLGPRTSVPLPPQPVGPLFSTGSPPSDTSSPLERPGGGNDLDGGDYAQAGHATAARPERSETESDPVAPTHHPTWAQFAPSMQALLDELALLGPTKWTLSDLVVENGINLLIGHPKSGKSLALMHAMAAYVVGDPFLHHKPPPDGTRIAVYVTDEGSRHDMQARLTRLAGSFPALAATNRFRVAYAKRMKFTEAHLRQLLDLLAGLESDLSARPGPHRVWMVLDPLRTFMPGGSDENEAKHMAPVFDFLTTLKATFPWLTLTIVHHKRKSAGRRDSSGLEAAGSGALYGGVDGVVSWWADKEEPGEADPEGLFVTRPLMGHYDTEGRELSPARVKWLYDSVTGLIVPRKVERTFDAAGRARAGETTDVVLDHLTAVGTLGATAREVAEATLMSQEAARSALKRGVSLGRFTSTMDAGASRYYLAGLSPATAPDGLLPEGSDTDYGPLPGH